MRRMTPARRLYYALGLPVLRGLIRLLTWTYRVETVIGVTVLVGYLPHNPPRLLSDLLRFDAYRPADRRKGLCVNRPLRN